MLSKKVEQPADFLGRFVLSEYAYASVAFAGLPAWIFQSIMPFAFAGMALRFAFRLMRDARELIRGGATERA